MNSRMPRNNVQFGGTHTHGSYPTDEEIALLAFAHWQSEGCAHLRLEHWLNAERSLLQAYADPQPEFGSHDRHAMGATTLPGFT